MKDPFWGIKAEGTLKFLHVSCYFTSPAGFKVTQNPIEGCDQRFRRRLCIFQSNPCALGKDLKLAKPLRDFMEWKAAWCCIWLLINTSNIHWIYDFDRDEHPAILDFDVKTKEAPGYGSIPVRLGHVRKATVGFGLEWCSLLLLARPNMIWQRQIELDIYFQRKPGALAEKLPQRVPQKTDHGVWQGGVLGDTPFLQTGCISKYLSICVAARPPWLHSPPGTHHAEKLPHKSRAYFEHDGQLGGNQLQERPPHSIFPHWQFQYQSDGHSRSTFAISNWSWQHNKTVGQHLSRPKL